MFLAWLSLLGDTVVVVRKIIEALRYLVQFINKFQRYKIRFSRLQWT